MDFIDKQGFLRYLDSNETKIKRSASPFNQSSKYQVLDIEKIKEKYRPTEKYNFGELVSFGEWV